MVGLVLVAILLFRVMPFVTRATHGEGTHILERSIQRAIVQCYALEGRYPPTLSYMRDRYGLLYDESNYLVHYEIFASNLMPNVTIIQRGAS